MTGVATINKVHVEAPLPALPLLRSVSLPSGHQIKQVDRRRATSNEPVLLLEALKANNNTSDNHSSQFKIEEEYLQGFLQWASRQSVRQLPCVSPDLPLMPTRITLRGVPLTEITRCIADCLQRLQEQGVFFSHQAHPNAGRVDICCMTCKLKFVIQLWQTVDQGIVVELQRRRGCSVFMHHLRRPLFAGLKALKRTTEHRHHESMELQSTVETTETAKAGPFRRLSLLFPPPLRSSFQ
ncbi:expressed unknown protein [Seminavis robusta]|uniref:Uncharacterized protein n=1 Tax=Seminavis robusta TaxID=568900 RepID=A0A9N8E5H6_9STRA|nr:expressed unknown protein [Seminavis robusta]|eukprot:Sro640_g179840.1 n/a (239) ;mRNA; f:9060-9776